MKRLIKGADWKMFLILDNLRVHHSKIVKDWVAKHEDVVWLNLLLLFIEGLLDVSFGRFNDLRLSFSPEIVKLWESPQHSWGFTGDY